MRVAELHEIADERPPRGRAAREACSAIAQRVRTLVTRKYRLLNEVLIPAMRRGHRLPAARPTGPTRSAPGPSRCFLTEIEPLLTPIALDPAHPFPRILNKSLNFIVELDGRDAFGRRAGIAVLQAPRALPRLLRVPVEISGFPHGLMLLTSVVRGFVDRLFPGLKVRGCTSSASPATASCSSTTRRSPTCARLCRASFRSGTTAMRCVCEVSAECPDAIVDRLMKEFELGDDDVYRVDGQVNLNRLSQVLDLVDRPDLKFPVFEPGLPAALRGRDLCDAIRKGDVLLHHPYESFGPVTDFLGSGCDRPRRGRDQARPSIAPAPTRC